MKVDMYQDRTSRVQNAKKFWIEWKFYWHV